MKTLLNLMYCMAFLQTVPSAYAHDVVGLAEELADREAGRFEYDSDQIDRLRVFQMLGSDPSQGQTASIIEQFGVGDGSPEQIFLSNYRWAQGKTLTVCFFDGTAGEQDSVIKTFEEILAHTNLGLATAKVSCPVKGVDIQIRIGTSGCSSTYGRASRSALAEDPLYATMKLCNRASPSFGDQNESVVRHEFMHALGFVHEQQHGDQKCFDELDIEKAGAVLFPKNAAEEWPELLKVNMFKIEKSIPDAVLAQLPYDKASIMHYQLPREAFRADIEPTCVLETKNRKLSAGDKRMLRAMYPSGASGVVLGAAAEGVTEPGELLGAAVEALSGSDDSLRPRADACLKDEACTDALQGWVQVQLKTIVGISAEIDGGDLGADPGVPFELTKLPTPESGASGENCPGFPSCNATAVEDQQVPDPTAQTDSMTQLIEPSTNPQVVPNIGGVEGFGLPSSSSTDPAQLPWQDWVSTPAQDPMNPLPTSDPGDETEPTQDPLAPVQVPGVGGGICAVNPLCKELLQRLNGATATYDYGLP